MISWRRDRFDLYYTNNLFRWNHAIVSCHSLQNPSIRAVSNRALLRRNPQCPTRTSRSTSLRQCCRPRGSLPQTWWPGSAKTPWKTVVPTSTRRSACWYAWATSRGTLTRTVNGRWVLVPFCICPFYFLCQLYLLTCISSNNFLHFACYYYMGIIFIILFNFSK